MFILDSFIYLEYAWVLVLNFYKIINFRQLKMHESVSFLNKGCRWKNKSLALLDWKQSFVCFISALLHDI